MRHLAYCILAAILVLATLAIAAAFAQAPTPLPGPAPAPIVVTGPDQIAQYKLVRLEVNADANAIVIWDVYPEENVDIDERSDSKLAFTAPPGTYKVKCRVIVGKAVQLARKVVTINGPALPTDALSTALQQALDAELPADRGKVGDLAAIYRHGATAGVPVAATVKQLTDAMHAAVQAGIGDSLPKVRRVLGDELNKQLPADGTAQLDAPLRAKYAEQFTRLATLLEGLK